MYSKSEKAPRRCDAGRPPDEELFGDGEAPNRSEAKRTIFDEQSKRSVGRPKGRNSLIGDHDVPLWIALSELLSLDKHAAADLVTLLMSDHPVTITDVDGLLVCLTTDLRMTSIKSRSGNLVKKVSNTNLTAAEGRWIVDSAMFLKLLADTFLSATMGVAEREVKRAFAADNLIALGWADPMRRIHQRLLAAFTSNRPPSEEALKRKARSLLEACRRRAHSAAGDNARSNYLRTDISGAAL